MGGAARLQAARASEICPCGACMIRLPCRPLGQPCAAVSWHCCSPLCCVHPQQGPELGAFPCSLPRSRFPDRARLHRHNGLYECYVRGACELVRCCCILPPRANSAPECSRRRLPLPLVHTRGAAGQRVGLQGDRPSPGHQLSVKRAGAQRPAAGGERGGPAPPPGAAVHLAPADGAERGWHGRGAASAERGGRGSADAHARDDAALRGADAHSRLCAASVRGSIPLTGRREPGLHTLA